MIENLNSCECRIGNDTMEFFADSKFYTGDIVEDAVLVFGVTDECSEICITEPVTLYELKRRLGLDRKKEDEMIGWFKDEIDINPKICTTRNGDYDGLLLDFSSAHLI